MKKLFAVVLIIAAFSAAYIYIQDFLENVEARLEQRASAALGMPVSIGKVHLSVVPVVGIALDSLTVDGSEMCSPSARIKRALLQLDFWSLLSRKIVFRQLVVDGADIVLPITITPAEIAKCAELESPVAAEPKETKVFETSYELNWLNLKKVKLHLANTKQSLVDIASLAGAIDLNNDRFALKGFSGYLKINSFDFNLVSELIEYWRHDDRVTVANATLKSPQIGSVAFSRAQRSADNLIDGEVAADIQLREFASFINQIGVPINPAKVDGGLAAQLKLQWGGDAPKIDGTFRGKSVAVTDGNQNYTAQSISGRLNLAKEKLEWRGTGTAETTGFGFRDPDIAIEKVNAALKKLALKISKHGDVSVTADADGSSFVFKSPGFYVNEVQRLSGPLTVSVPSKGGYKVTVPVTAQDAIMGSDRWQVTKVNGTIDMSFVRGQQKFSSKQLRARYSDLDTKFNGTFEINPTAYLFTEMKLQGVEHNIFVDGAYGRKEGDEVRILWQVRDTEAGKFLKFYNSALTDLPQGTFKDFKGSVKGKRGSLDTTLTGSGDVEFIQGVVTRRRNFIELLENAIRQVPVISYLADLVRGERKKGRRTASNLRVVNGIIHFDNLRLKADNFSLKGAGTSTLDGQLDIKADIIFLRDTISSLSMGIKVVRDILRSASTLTVPIILSGKIPDHGVSVDTVMFMKRYSGYTTVESIAGSVVGAGQFVGDLVTSPFRSSTPTPSATPQ